MKLQTKLIPLSMLLSIWLLAGWTICAIAQSNPPEAEQPLVKLTQWVDTQLNALTEQLDLTEHQQASVRKIYVNYFNQLQLLFAQQSAFDRDRHEDFQQIQLQANNQIQSILNADQRSKFAVIQQHQVSERQDQFTEALLEFRLADLERRLQLDAGQSNQVHDLLTRQFDEMQPILQRLRDSDDGQRRQRLQSLRLLQDLQKRYDQRIEAILSEDQRAEYRVYRQEQRDQLRSRRRG